MTTDGPGKDGFNKDARPHREEDAQDDATTLLRNTQRSFRNAVILGSSGCIFPLIASVGVFFGIRWWLDWHPLIAMYIGLYLGAMAWLLVAQGLSPVLFAPPGEHVESEFRTVVVKTAIGLLWVTGFIVGAVLLGPWFTEFFKSQMAWSIVEGETFYRLAGYAAASCVLLLIIEFVRESRNCRLEGLRGRCPESGNDSEQIDRSAPSSPADDGNNPSC